MEQQREITIINRLLSSDVKKPTALVHFQRNMSQVAQRVMTLIIFNAQDTEPDAKGHYEIRTSMVMDFLGWTESKNYEGVYQAFREIKGNDIVWNFLGEDRTLDELLCSFLITLGISRRSGLIRYKLHPELLPIIRNPSVFAKLKLVMLAILAQPKYAYPLYEFVADAYCRGKPVERISIAKLKEYLGIPTASYTEWMKFKEQVLQPNLAAVNQISDYSVTYRTYREGRRVAGVIFDIERKAQWQTPMLFDKPLDVLRRHFGPDQGIGPAASLPDAAGTDRFVQAVARHGIGERVARQAVTAHGLDGAREILTKVGHDVKRRAKSGAPIHDTSAYLARCLIDGLGKLSDAERATATRKKDEAAAQERAAIEREQAEQIAEAARTARNREIDARLAALTAEELEALRAAFAEEIVAGKRHGEMIAAAFQAKGWQARGVEGFFRSFAAERLGILTNAQIEAKFKYEVRA